VGYFDGTLIAPINSRQPEKVGHLGTFYFGVEGEGGSELQEIRKCPWDINFERCMYILVTSLLVNAVAERARNVSKLGEGQNI